MHDIVWIRWFMVVFFTGFGAWMLITRDSFANASGFFRCFHLDEPAQTRLVSAYRRRERSEALPSASMGGVLGALSLALALIAALTQAPVTLLYAADVFALAAILTLGYARLRRATRRRFASLHVRAAGTIAPWYAWAIVAITSVLPLAWLPRTPVSACLVTAAGVAIVLLAWRVASLPALLNGEDLAVEAFVDERLRAARVTNLLSTAVAPSFVFEAFTGYTDSPLHVAALSVAFVAFNTMLWLYVRLLRRGPSVAEVSAWSRAAH